MSTTTAAGLGLGPEDLEELGRELDDLGQRVRADLGQADVDYIRRVIAWQRGLEATGRASLFLSFLPPMWLAGVAALSLSKILDNMEIGHNVMHGQYDWTRDPALSSTTFEWDTACPGEQWRHSHNYLHHTFTNIVGKDRDLGYGIIRVSENQRWSLVNLGNPLYAVVLAAMFEHGVALHDAELDQLLSGSRSWPEVWPTLRASLAKSVRQGVKDYVLWPALTGPMGAATVAADLVANLVRNGWAFTIIFCGHFPSGTHEFAPEECHEESRGHWYLRQMLGSSNISGGRLLHLMSGNLSFQIEHHLFPDLPARRYGELSTEVERIAARYCLPYNTAGLARQFGSVMGKIIRFAVPTRPRSVSVPPAGPEQRVRSTPAAPLAA